MGVRLILFYQILQQFARPLLATKLGRGLGTSSQLNFKLLCSPPCVFETTCTISWVINMYTYLQVAEYLLVEGQVFCCDLFLHSNWWPILHQKRAHLIMPVHTSQGLKILSLARQLHCPNYYKCIPYHFFTILTLMYFESSVLGLLLTVDKSSVLLLLLIIDWILTSCLFEVVSWGIWRKSTILWTSWAIFSCPACNNSNWSLSEEGSSYQYSL